MNDQEPHEKLNHIIKTAQSELTDASPDGFSPEGYERLRKRINEYVRQLTIESMKISKRHQSDSISPAYVDRAAEYLVSTRFNRWQKLVEGLGSIILGVGLAAAGSMIQSASFSTRGLILCVVCTLVGMPAFMFHLMKD
jgi:hypothetical protein